MIFLSILSLWIFLFPQDENLPLKLFPFKSGILEFEANYRDGTTKTFRTLYIEDYGEKLCMDYKIISRGEKHFIYIFKKDISYSINMNMKYAGKRKNPPELFDDEALSDWFREILYGNRKKNIMSHDKYKGRDVVLGKECEVFSDGESKYWVWNNLILKWEDKYKIEEVKKVQIDVIIPEGKFEVPKGVFVFPKIF